MSVSPGDIFKLAEELNRSAAELDSEASRRSSASRAYYAAMHATMAAIPDDLTPTEREMKEKDSHSKISDAVTKWAGQVRNGRGEARIMARKLPKLKFVRKMADYKIWEEFTVDQAAGALRDAAEIMRAASEADRKVKALVAQS